MEIHDNRAPLLAGPPGRLSLLPNYVESAPVRVVALPLQDGRDSDGVFWGSGDPVFEATNKRGFCTYVRAASMAHATVDLDRAYPGIVFDAPTRIHALMAAARVTSGTTPTVLWDDPDGDTQEVLYCAALSTTRNWRELFLDSVVRISRYEGDSIEVFAHELRINPNAFARNPATEGSHG